MTQKNLAEAAGCDQSAISGYLKGRVPNGEVLVSLARALGTTAEALLGTAGESLVVREQPASYGIDWRQRALDAERKLVQLKSELESLLKKI